MRYFILVLLLSITQLCSGQYYTLFLKSDLLEISHYPMYYEDENEFQNKIKKDTFKFSSIIYVQDSVIQVMVDKSAGKLTDVSKRSYTYIKSFIHGNNFQMTILAIDDGTKEYAIFEFSSNTVEVRMRDSEFTTVYKFNIIN